MDKISSAVYFLQGAALGVTAAAAPGPFQTFLISETLKGGWHHSLPITIAPLLADLPIILVSLFFLDKLPAYFLNIITIIGGFFILYLAWSAWCEWRVGPENLDITDSETIFSKGLLKGMLMNFLSPGPYIFWMLVNGPILLAALSRSPLDAAAFLLGFYGIFVGSLVILVILFDQTRRLGARVVHALLFLSIVILGVFGLVLLKQGLFPYLEGFFLKPIYPH
jgi:threonine/homoserine/homoserine lactone efflux protein